jgi:hypothetical protein
MHLLARRPSFWSSTSPEDFWMHSPAGLRASARFSVEIVEDHALPVWVSARDDPNNIQWQFPWTLRPAKTGRCL